VIKNKIQGLLRRLGAYDRLQETLAYDCYRSLRFGRPVMWRRNERRFYQAFFSPPPRNFLVFDVGANRGRRTELFLRLGAKVVAVEPDALNQRLLARRFFGRPVTVVGKAVSEENSVATLRVHAPGSGLNSLSEKWVRMLAEDDKRFGSRQEFSGSQEVETVTLESLIDAYGVPHYIKVDVEGHEPSVLRGLRRPVPFLSFEVNLPEFLAEGIECVGILGRLSAGGGFNLSPDCQGGLSLPRWLAAAEFTGVLRGRREESVEVFWRSQGAE
jgi:FkbM family methyltransferase